MPMVILDGQCDLCRKKRRVVEVRFYDALSNPDLLRICRKCIDAIKSGIEADEEDVDDE